MANLKNITELPVAESADGLNLIVNDNGSAKQIAASAVGAQADFAVTDETSPAFIKNKPEVVQADWSVTDETGAAFIKNKPFYDTREYGKITVTFDGDMTGKESVLVNETDTETSYFVKLSDKIPTKEEAIGAFASGVMNGSAATTEVTSDMITDYGNGNFSVIDLAMVVSNEFTADNFTLSHGLWVAYVIKDGVATTYGTEFSWTGVVSGELKIIEEKYVPRLAEEWDLDLTCDITWNTETSDANDPVFTAAEGYSYKAFIAKIKSGDIPKVKFRMNKAVTSDTTITIMDRHCNIITEADAPAIFISIGTDTMFVELNSDGTFTTEG